MWIKICGLTDPVAAEKIASLRPDAIGLNFYERSARFVSIARARQIREVVPPETELIGIFVDASVETIRQAIAECGLDGVQLHASGTRDAFAEWETRGEWSEQGKTAHERSQYSPFRKIRAFQVGAAGLSPLKDYYEECRRQRVAIDACLLDAYVEGRYGGTGTRAPWELLKNAYQMAEWPPLILAGGLRAENVAEAIAKVRPWGVDVASGVESAPAVKDLALVAQFIAEARRAFEELN